jgi:hypothetical protein
LLAGELAFGAATRLFAQGGFKGRTRRSSAWCDRSSAPHSDRTLDVFIAGAAIGSQQDLCPLQPSRGALAGAQQPAVLIALLSCQIDAVADIRQASL